jgi:hypothetical protein
MKKYLTGLAVLLFIGAGTANAADLDSYTKIAKTTMNQVSSGSVGDVDKLIAMQEQLISIGQSAIKEYVAKNPNSAKMLNLVNENANKMKGMSLAQIEKEWHEKGFLKSKGIDAALMKEKSVTGSLMDTVVHPATAIIALNEYKKTKDKKLLQQVHDELEEVVHHVERIK